MKLILLLASVFVTLNVHAQIDSVNYKGAFPAGQPMWTDGWCNWNPDSTSYPATNVTVCRKHYYKYYLDF
jgi:hypothetical protein